MLLIVSVFSNSINAEAAYSGEQKHSIYDYQSVMSQIYPGFKIIKDNHGYYARYKNHGNFEVYLGKTKNMYFSDFAKKFGGTTNCNKKVFKVTKTERELKKLAVGALIAYITTQCGCAWYAAYLLGVAGDKTMDKILRQPGTYRMTTVASTVRIRDGALKNKNYSTTYVIYPYTKLEKK